MKEPVFRTYRARKRIRSPSQYGMETASSETQGSEDKREKGGCQGAQV